MLGSEPSGSLVMPVGWFGLVAVTVLAGVIERVGRCFEQPYCRKSTINRLCKVQKSYLFLSWKQSPRPACWGSDCV